MKGHRPIKDFPGYWISWKGHCYSEGLGGYLKEQLNIKSYYRVRLFNDEHPRGKWKFLHRLTCDHYKKNPNPLTHTEVHHIYFDKSRNGARDVRHVTPDENKRLNKFRMQVIAREAAKEKAQAGITDPF